MSSLSEVFHQRPRLLIALAAGVIIALLLPQDWKLITRLLTGWNVAVWSYLILMAWLVGKTHHLEIQNIAEQEDKGAIALLAIMSAIAILSLAAIGLELASVHDLLPGERISHYALIAITILGSWLLVSIIFTFHYAHTFYLSDKESRAFTFPDNTQQPNYWDFLYFSFTISVAAQTSDINVMTTSSRKAVTAQAVLSFLFNAAIIGLLINIAAGIIGAR